MKYINISFENEQQKRDFVMACELDFEKRLCDVSNRVKNTGVESLLLSGPTCSGKTTTANKIISDFEQVGRQVSVISLDNFFKPRADQRAIVDNDEIDYDSVNALDLDILTACVNQARQGRTVKMPIYDFITQTANKYETLKIDENGVIIFEGIQAVYPEITSLFKERDYIGVFINVDEDVMINGVFFSRDDIRLSRRLVRDYKFRGANAEFTLFLWDNVRKNEDQSIYPNKNAVCKVQLNSFLDYELFLLRGYIIDILNEVEENSKYYKKAMELRDKFLKLDTISYDYVPKNSLYTEFLGKKQ
ncbi:MAG: hypothetical protein IJZ04_01925 [Clostridia bacterium]|nr:hypothetical protein [Clostridia bacterium]